MGNTEELRNLIVDKLKEYKTYQLDGICKKYGLSPSDELNAKKSKRVYLESALSCCTFHQLQELLIKLAHDEDDPEFTKRSELYLGDNYFEISLITRRKVLNWICSQISLEGKLSIDELLSKIWLLENVPSKYGKSNAKEDIFQHMVRNDDIGYRELFEDILLLMYVSDTQLIAFINVLLCPCCRCGDEEQLYYAQEIGSLLMQDGFRIEITRYISGEPIYEVTRNYAGKSAPIKNLVFASCGQKPDIVLEDALTNDIKIIDEGDHCLFYTLPIENGLTWRDLTTWWNNGNEEYTLEIQKSLVERLLQSVDSEPEEILLKAYYNFVYKQKNDDLPALIPQVYCHYDPKSAKMRKGTIYVHQRMDFLLLFSNNQRVVIEIDGKQHYSDDAGASPKLYAQMVEDDRKLKLYGYEVYRFGGYEFCTPNLQKRLVEFFSLLFERYGS